MIQAAAVLSQAVAVESVAEKQHYRTTLLKSAKSAELA
jgi:hypothetical protein